MLHGGVYNARAMARRGDFVYCFFAPALSDYNFIQSEILYRAENDYRYGMPHSRTYCIILYPTPSTPHTASRSPDNPGAGPRGDESREVCSCLRDRPSVNASWRPGSWDAKGILGIRCPEDTGACPGIRCPQDTAPYPGDMPVSSGCSSCPRTPTRVFKRPPE